MKYSKYTILIAAVFLISSCGNRSTRHNEASSADVNLKLSAEDIYKQSIDKVALVMCYQDGIPYSQGTGFFINDNTLVTNYHVIDGCNSYELKIAGNDEVFKGAYVERASPEYDIAILQTKQSFPYFSIDSLGMDGVGAKIYTIGNPRGLEGTISEGIISGKRFSEEIQYIQITSPISPGNSGGPVINEQGNVIGISTFTYKNSQNLNFAMPISYISKCEDIGSLAKKSVKSIIKNDADAIELVTYSKEPLMLFQQVSFRNNTNETIKSVSGVFIFRKNNVDYKRRDDGSMKFKYFNKSIGEVFNYQLFNIDIDIAPHMTKLINIPCEEVMLFHSYCENFCTGCGDNNNIHYHVDFKLLSYEVEE